MTGRLLSFPPAPERRLPRARVTRVGFRKDDLRWIVSCPCGLNAIEHVAAEASRRKRAHDAEHRAAEAWHPAGTARARGGRS